MLVSELHINLDLIPSEERSIDFSRLDLVNLITTDIDEFNKRVKTREDAIKLIGTPIDWAEMPTLFSNFYNDNIENIYIKDIVSQFDFMRGFYEMALDKNWRFITQDMVGMDVSDMCDSLYEMSNVRTDADLTLDYLLPSNHTIFGIHNKFNYEYWYARPRMYLCLVRKSDKDIKPPYPDKFQELLRSDYVKHITSEINTNPALFYGFWYTYHIVYSDKPPFSNYKFTPTVVNSYSEPIEIRFQSELTILADLTPEIRKKIFNRSKFIAPDSLKEAKLIHDIVCSDPLIKEMTAHGWIKIFHNTQLSDLIELPELKPNATASEIIKEVHTNLKSYAKRVKKQLRALPKFDLLMEGAPSKQAKIATNAEKKKVEEEWTDTVLKPKKVVLQIYEGLTGSIS
jgi:hypothetical protein